MEQLNTLVLTHKYQNCVLEKHSSLFRPTVSDEEKMLHNIDFCNIKGHKDLSNQVDN